MSTAPSCSRCPPAPATSSAAFGSLETRPRDPHPEPAESRFLVARSVAVTFDYRCPFAYNGNLAVVNAIRSGTDVEFRFAPFSLDQVHVAEGEPAAWDRDPAEWGTGVL